MAIEKLGGVSGAGQSPAIETGKEKFGKVLEQAGRVGGHGATPQGLPQPGSEVAPRQVVDAQRADAVQRAKAGCAVKAPGVTEARSVSRTQATPPDRHVEAARVIDQVNAAQKRLDRILEMAQQGKNFTPAELIAMQAHVYRASQELDLAGKVVEKATAGVKQILQTQV
ncbi:MAG: ATP-dependent helicase HrpB [Myxococcaceae bacterium]|nr:ATP-dependent helicase HrpB [Myxococcaceae bacterium]